MANELTQRAEAMRVEFHRKGDHDGQRIMEAALRSLKPAPSAREVLKSVKSLDMKPLADFYDYDYFNRVMAALAGPAPDARAAADLRFTSFRVSELVAEVLTTTGNHGGGTIDEKIERGIRAGYAEAIGRVFRAATLPEQPADSVVVPREPTEAMLDAARKHAVEWSRELRPMQPLDRDTWTDACIGRHRAMLAAAPTLPQAEQPSELAEERAKVDALLAGYERAFKDSGDHVQEMTLGAVRAANRMRYEQMPNQATPQSAVRSTSHG